MKKLPLILFIAVLSLMFSCIKNTDPKPSSSSSGNVGSWTYKGTSYTGTFSMWSSNSLLAQADKPHVSSLQAYFSSNSPTTGNYPVGDPYKNSNEVTIGLVDGTLPGISYLAVPNKEGTVSVSRSGSTTTVTVTKVLLIAFKPDATPDSVVVTGTIVK